MQPVQGKKKNKTKHYVHLILTQLNPSCGATGGSGGGGGGGGGGAKTCLRVNFLF